MQLSPKLPWNLAQTKWAQTLNPVLAIPMLSGNQINNITLPANKATAINHLLQRMPQGWFLVDQTKDSTVWRPAAYTITTITLEASGATIVSIWVY